MLKENLKKMRGKRTQEEIANKLGISRARYSHYENGIREPDNKMLEAIADLYNVTVDSLLGRGNLSNKIMFYNETKNNIREKLQKQKTISSLEYELLEKLEEFLYDEKIWNVDEANLIDKLISQMDSQNDIEAEFQAFANNPSLQKWYKELPKSREEDLEKLRMMWEILKSSEK